MKLYNHITSSLSDLDNKIIKDIPSGGNWTNVPKNIHSKHIDKIRETGGRTTYYGRLCWDYPSYTITTYFNRPGNGCNIHPDDKFSKKPQQRLISIREAARLQSFKDNFKFYGSKSSMYKQIGNAVPPLLAYAIAKTIPGSTAVDLFCGSGGLSKGFEYAGYKILAGIDNDKNAIETWKNNHKGESILLDITDKKDIDFVIEQIKKKLNKKKLDVIIGGPPCQGFSTAGWRKSNDKRNLLWKNYFEVVKKLKPKFFLIENVPGFISASLDGQKIVSNMSKEFEKIGYRLSIKKLEAEKYLVPQKRRRIFVIGRIDKKDHIFPNAIENKIFTVRDAIENLPRLSFNDGKEEINVKHLYTKSLYQKYLSGSIDANKLFSKFKKVKKLNTQFNLF